MSIKILIVENNAAIALNTQSYLESSGYDVMDIAYSAEAALNKINEDKPDLVLMDAKLTGEINSIQATETIKKWFNLPVILLTTNSKKEEFNQNFSEYDGYLKKPFMENELEEIIQNFTNKKNSK
jgi:CheY-like chemotaxis protein